MYVHNVIERQQAGVFYKSGEQIPQFPYRVAVAVCLYPPAMVFFPLVARFVRLDDRRYAAPRLARRGHYKNSCHDKS